MAATFQHPLMGARFGHLISSLVRNGGVRPRYWPLAAGMVAAATFRAPLSLVEQVVLRRRLKTGPALEPPVFIIGHWRSGTTHLHNILGRSPLFGHISPLASGLPDQLLTLATWLRPWLEKALPEDRHVDRVAVKPDSPQEDEIPLANLQPLSIFHALYFPRNFERHVARGVFFDGVTREEERRWQESMRSFLCKVALHQGKGQLLVKNPVYTARIRGLRTIWPAARFVYIRRNPYLVYASTRTYYQTLLKDLSLQSYAHIDIESFVLDTYIRLLNEYEEQKKDLDPRHLCEVTFEELEADPVGVAKRIHHDLGLEGWSRAEPEIARYLGSIEGYRKNRLDLTKEDIQLVERRWHAWLRGYTPP
ncbi:MAG: sulfotransferase [Myxococcota bacterium]